MLQNKTAKWIKNILIVVFVILLSGLTAFWIEPRSLSAGADSFSAIANDVEYVGYTEEGNGFRSVSNDPQIHINGINREISEIEIVLTNALENNTKITVFFMTSRTEGYCESNSQSFQFPEGESQIILPLKCMATSLRIDIGEAPGIYIEIDEIRLTFPYAAEDLSPSVLESEMFWLRFELLCLLFGFIGLHGIIGPKRLYTLLYRYRWQIGISLIILFTANKLHGDSIGGYDYYIQTGLGSKYVEPVFGKPRLIRTDDWVSYTGKVLSSRFLENPFGKYNDLIRATRTVNPLYSGWGNLGRLGYSASAVFYRLLGVEYGFCLEWNASTILTLLFTFELFLILTKKKKLLSLLGTVLIVFSAFHLWWGIPSFLLYLHAGIVMFYHFFVSDNKWVKAACAIGEPIAISNFICILYPAWQVPAGYVLLVFIGWILYENWEKIKHQQKSTWILFTVALVACICLTVAYCYSIVDKTAALSNTIYPGERVSTGGDVSNKLFYYFQSFLYPFKDFGNPPEASVFCSLFPLPFISTLLYFAKKRKQKKNPLLIGLFSVGILYLIYAYIGFPLWLSKLTFLSYSLSDRIADLISLISVYLLVLILSERQEMQWNFRWSAGLLISAAIVGYSIYICRKDFSGYMSGLYIITVGVMLVFFGMSILSKINKHLLKGILISVIIVTTISGICVRPLQKGFDAVDSKPLAQKIREINSEDPDKKWLAVSEDFILPAFVLASGGATINSINDYPNLELWRQLDQSGQYNDIYNRYAHVLIEFCEEETSFELIQTDMIKIWLSYSDLSVTRAKYIVSDYRLEADNQYVVFEEIYDEAGVYIYIIYYK